MKQANVLRLKHHVPDGCRIEYPGMSDEVRAMMPYLVAHASRRWTEIPGHEDIAVFSDRKQMIPFIYFRKNGKDIYIHVLCNEFMDRLPIPVICDLYAKYGYGIPGIVKGEPNWIHTIPIPGAEVSREEIILTYQITQSLFWTIHHEYKLGR